MATSRRGFVAGASAIAVLGANSAFAQKKYDDGATDTEIKIGHMIERRKEMQLMQLSLL